MSKIHWQTKSLGLFILILCLSNIGNNLQAQGSLLDKYYAKPVFEQLNIDESEKKPEKVINSGVYSINMEKGQELMDEGKYQEAIHYFIKARELFDSDDGDGFQNRDKLLISKNTPLPEYYTAKSYQYLEKYDSAIIYYKKTIEEVPYFIEVYNELGNLYFFLDQYENAIKYLRKGHEVNPKYNEITHNLGYAYTVQGRYSKAREYLELAVEQDSSLLPTYKVLANIHSHFGRLSTAEETLKECIEKNPDDIRAYYLKVNYYLENFDIEKTRAALVPISEKFPDDYKSSIYIGVLDLIQDDYLQGTNILQETYIKLKDSLDPNEPQNNEYYKLEINSLLESLIDTEYSDEEKILIGKVIKDKIAKRASISTTEEIKKFYQDNPDKALARRLFLLYSYLNDEENDMLSTISEFIQKDSLPSVQFLLARLYFSNDNYDTCILVLKNYIRMEANNAAAYYYIGASQRRTNRFEEALENLNKAIEYSPYMTNAYFERGITYQSLDSSDQALDDFYTFNIGNSQSPWSHYFIGFIYETRNEFDSAKMFYTNAIEVSTNHYFAYYRRARLEYDNFDNSYKAFSDINKSLSINPDFVDALNYRAYLNWENDKDTEAKKDYDRVAKLAPDNANIRKNKGNFYMHIEDWETASEVFLEAVKIDSVYSYAFVRLADAKFELKELDSAILYYKKALDIDSNYTYAQFRIAYVFSDLEKHDSAVVHYQRTLAIDSNYTSAYGNLGWEHYLLGNFKKSIEYSLIETGRNDEAYYAKYNIALAFLRMGQFDKSKTIYSETIAEATKDSTEGALGDLQDLIDDNIMTEQAKEIIDLYFNKDDSSVESEE